MGKMVEEGTGKLGWVGLGGILVTPCSDHSCRSTKKCLSKFLHAKLLSPTSNNSSLDFNVSSGARIIAFTLVFMVIPHRCGANTVYTCMQDPCVYLHLRVSTKGRRGCFIFYTFFHSTLLLLQRVNYPCDSF